MKKLLCLCDSPTVQTGFGRVAYNLLAQWAGSTEEAPAVFEQIDVWGINYHGTPHNLPYRIWPGGGVGWERPERLAEFCNLLATGDYTHVWLMQDLFALSAGNFPRYLKQICDSRGIVSSIYFPVDSPVEREWCAIIDAVDYPVAYTEYARNVVCTDLENHKYESIPVIPHGVDTGIYRPTGRKTALREQLFPKSFVSHTDLLIVNSNMNQKRKDILSTMLIVQELRRRGVPAKLVLNMTERSMDETHLEQIARQIGFKHGVDWDHMDRYFRKGFPRITESGLNDIYNAADLYLSTSLGEGFGLGMIEALAAGCPVAVPGHTACDELARAFCRLGMPNQIVGLPLAQFPISLPHDNSRIRYPVNVELAADAICEKVARFEYGRGLSDGAREWLDWGRIGDEFVSKVFSREKPAGAPLYMEMGGGLGDVFHQYITRHYYQLLEDLRPNQQVTIALASHNPAAKEIFEAHPKRAQIKVLDLGYWNPADDQKMRAVHGLPQNPPLPLRPAKLGPPKFYPLPSDGPVFSEMISRVPFLLFALSAGMSGRTFPGEIACRCTEDALAKNWDILWTGRNYPRNAENDQSHYEILPQDLPTLRPQTKIVNAVGRLSAPGTALMVQQCAGIITCHSALSLLAWHFGKPMLLLYPESAWEEHIKHRDQWAFGIDNPNTVHALFSDFTPDLLEKFFSLL